MKRLRPAAMEQPSTKLDTTMPTLTTLPQALQSHILKYLFDKDIYNRRSKLNNADYYLPGRYPGPYISLDEEQTVNAPFPPELLAPALASPVLAATACALLGDAMTFLTDANTEARLPLWVKAFAAHVEAIRITDMGEQWKNSLPRQLRTKMLDKFCSDTMQLFREITVNDVRLRVLDLVNVPFHKCGSMRDAMMTGLCMTLESTQTTLEELALPVFLKSDLCACALETVTLPHLLVFSIELKGMPNYRHEPIEQLAAIDAVFLRMMRAVDGHADRSNRLTTLDELRLINLYHAPGTTMVGSGCSQGFFHAVRTLRIGTRHQCYVSPSVHRLEFFLLFRELRVLHWTCMPHGSSMFRRLCKKLKQVHLCNNRWISRVELGSKRHVRPTRYIAMDYWDILAMSDGKIRTLMTPGMLDDLERIAICCPHIEYLSVHVAQENLQVLRALIVSCKLLTGLEIIIDEDKYGCLGNEGWQQLGKAIPRSHKKLCDVAIQTRKRCMKRTVPITIAFDCFAGVVKRMGSRAERLLFRAMVNIQSLTHGLDWVDRMMKSCMSYSPMLSHLELDIITLDKVKSTRDLPGLDKAQTRYASTKTLLIESLPALRKLEVEMWFFTPFEEDRKSW